MGEEWLSSVLKRGCVWVTHTSNIRIYKGSRWTVGKEHDRPGAGEEEYAAFCVECEGSERNGTRHLRSPCCTV